MSQTEDSCKKINNNLPTRSIQITISERCNLNCVYCYEHSKDQQCLDVERIKSIIKEAFLDSVEYPRLEFNFHGGEIALFFDTIKETCEWLWEQPFDKPYICFAATNGTLIRGEIKEWFEKNSHRFKLGVSLDGTREMHNKNRSNSFDDIDLDFFLRVYPEQYCKMTVSKETLPDITEGIIFLHKRGFNVNANLAYGLDWTNDLLGIYRDQLVELADFYLQHPEFNLLNLLAVPIWSVGNNALHPEQKKPCKWCGTGHPMVCYSPDGRKYPCQAFMPSTGIKDGDKLLQNIDFKDMSLFQDPKCEKCPFLPACPACYGHNYMATETLGLRPEGLCQFRKVEALAASYVQGKMLLDHEKYSFTKNMKEFQLVGIAKGVQIIQQQFADEVERF